MQKVNASNAKNDASNAENDASNAKNDPFMTQRPTRRTIAGVSRVVEPPVSKRRATGTVILCL